MRWPSYSDWLFSAKAFAAAMLALYVALAFDLPRPYWSMTAVYVVANPMSGATVSKALDRTLGTIVGAIGAVALTMLFIGAPELLTLAIALWSGTFLYAALHDRTPRNYAFMLAAYTLPLLVLPNVNTPETIFDIAVARSEEIIVGILAAAVIGTIVFPVSLNRVMTARIQGWLNDAGSCAREILLAKGAEPMIPPMLHRIAADISSLNSLLSQVSHDAGARDVKRSVVELRARLLSLLPLLPAIGDRMHALRLETGVLPAALEATTEDISAWIKQSLDDNDNSGPARIEASLTALEEYAGGTTWNGLIWSSLLDRLSELIAVWQDCLVLHGEIRFGRNTWRRPQKLRYRPLIGWEQHHDRAIIAFAVGSTALAIFLSGLLWIWSGWPAGANAVAFVAIACCFFSGLDQPAPPMKTMLIWSTVTYIFTGFYLFAVLPQLNDFALVAFALAPPFLVIGALIPRPELSLVTLLLAANLAGDLGLQGRYSADFSTYAEGGVAISAGLLFAWIWTLVTKPFGTEFVVQRLLYASWKGLADLASGSDLPDHGAMVTRALDRLSQLTPRILREDPTSINSLGGYSELRTGYNVITLQRHRRGLPPAIRNHIDTTLRGVAEFFRQCANKGERRSPPEGLLREIDQTLHAILSDEGVRTPRAPLDALVGLRLTLFPTSPSPANYEPYGANDNASAPALISAE